MFQRAWPSRLFADEVEHNGFRRVEMYLIQPEMILLIGVGQEIWFWRSEVSGCRKKKLRGLHRGSYPACKRGV